MNFFEHQERARSNSRRMVVLFGLAVLAVVAAINAVVLIVLGLAAEPGKDPQVSPAATAIVVTVITLAVIACGSLYKTFSLRGGGGAVARALGGSLVSGDTRDFHLRRLRNVVEEMAIASGMPVPEIYVLEQESAINAFAAGHSTGDAAIAVTRGALEHLSRDELQGVVAHEFSHILNGDMRLNLRLMGMIFGLLVLGLTGQKVLEHMRGGSRREGGAILLIALAVMIFGYLGMFLGRLIKAAISRQREYLADASAVQFTRLSSGLSGALMKIGAFGAGSKLVNDDTEEVAHMLFGDGRGYSALTATHPPIVDRIRRIDPRFDPMALTRLAQLERQVAAVDRDHEPPSAAELISGLAASSASTRRAQAAREDVQAAGEEAPSVAPPDAQTSDQVLVPTPAQVVARIAQPGVEHVDYATAIRTALPPILRAAAHMRDRAIDLLLALLISPMSDHEPALAVISAQLGEGRRTGTVELIGVVSALHPAQRMPLVQIAMPALRRRPPQELAAMLTCVDAIVDLDGRIDVFEYALARMARQQLEEARHPGEGDRSGDAKLPTLRAEALGLIAVLAGHGQRDPELARRAFMAGAAVLFPGDAAVMPVISDWPTFLDEALPRLDGLLPAGKEKLVMALASCVGHDEQIAITEAELLRLTCALLHCPLPPLISGAG
jgi:Zn-dependent protease with chaperone function